jgi:hypothetical protein
MMSHALLLILLAGQPMGRPIHLETDHLIYEIGADGRNVTFADRRTGKNFLANSSSFMSVTKDGRRVVSTSVVPDGGNLRVKFGDSGIEAQVRVRILPEYLTFELVSLSDPSVASVELADLPLTLTKYVSSTIASCRNEEYAAAVIPLNIETHSQSAGAVLVAEADRRVRLVGTRFALVGCPTNLLLKRIEKIELEQGLPHPTLGGVWARTSPEQMKSYLFVDLSEDTADAMIDYAKAGGFGYIVVYDGVWNSSHGTYPVNLKHFPHGEAGLRAVSDKIHRAGLKFGMHNLDAVVDKNDALVHPVPARGFMVFPDRRRTLAVAIGPQDAFLPTATSPAGLLAKTDKSRYAGRDLLLGDEIVTYDDLQTSPPYGFTGCKRGAHGTTPANHPAGAEINNLAEFIDYYLPDIESALYDRVAHAEAAALDKFGFDYLYPDGTGEYLPYWPGPPAWYIYNLLASKLYGYTRREVMFGHTPITDYSWHIFSRGNTTDYVHTGLIEHFDRESVAGTKWCVADLLPFEFGWFGYLVHAADAEATRPREMEYAWSKALAYGAAMSLETNKKTLDANGRTREIFATIRNWEELKLQNYFSKQIREQLKKPGQEFTLQRSAHKQWVVLPVTYSPDQYVAGEESWTEENPYAPQPLRVTIEAKPALAPYGDPANIVLLDPARPLNLNTSGSGPMGSPARTSEGLSFELTSDATGFEVAAHNHATPTAGAGWGSAEVIMDGAKDLRQHRALGTWVEGDGSGAFLHFLLEDSSRWSVRDYYVRLDFKGRRYVQIPESAGGEIYNFEFPYSNYWAIRNLDFQTISRLYIFLTNVSPQAVVRARFGRLDALKETPAMVANPGLNVNGEVVTFPAQIPTDWYLEFSGTGNARIFDPNGFTKGEVVPHGKIPSLHHGRNNLSFLGESGRPAKVTILTRGEPLH